MLKITSTLLKTASGYSAQRTRVLIFNCTSGRSGGEFLGGMLTKAAQQLAQHAPGTSEKALFEKVVFCANVTYADGHYKGGMMPALRSLPSP